MSLDKDLATLEKALSAPRKKAPKKKAPKKKAAKKAPKKKAPKKKAAKKKAPKKKAAKKKAPKKKAPKKKAPKKKAPTLSVGTRVKSRIDGDTGRVLARAGHRVLVGWDQGVRTFTDPADLKRA